MKQRLTLIILSLFTFSCAINTSFESLKGQDLGQTNVTVNAPVWLAKTFVPTEAKDEVNRLSRGMKKLRVIANESEQNEEISDLFAQLSVTEELDPYFMVIDDGSRVELLARRKYDIIKEIYLLFDSEDGSGILGLAGEMPISTFEYLLESDVVSKH